MRQVLIVAARPPSRLALQRALSRFMKVGIQTDLLLLNLPTANVDGLGLGDVHRTSRRYRRSDGPPASRWSRRWFEVIARNLFFSRIGPRLGRTADAWLTTRGDPWVDRKASASAALFSLAPSALSPVFLLSLLPLFLPPFSLSSSFSSFFLSSDHRSHRVPPTFCHRHFCLKIRSTSQCSC